MSDEIVQKQARRKQLVDRSIQGAIIGRAIFYLLSYNVSLLLLFAIAWGVQGSWGAISDRPAPEQRMTFWDQAAPMMVCMGGIMPFMILDLLRFSHRIAGPLVRFESIMCDFTNSGTLRKADLREFDLLRRFQQRFNQFVEAFHQRYPETEPGQATPPVSSSAADCNRQQDSLKPDRFDRNVGIDDRAEACTASSV